MGASQHGQLPPDQVHGRRRFQAWRERRKPGVRIPQPLWAIAIRLAKSHGVSRTSAALGLDYYCPSGWRAKCGNLGTGCAVGEWMS
jgi:hypothetical protein